MARLSDDSPIRSQILPSIWAGYTLPRSEIMGGKLLFEEKISASDVPQEWMDEMHKAFQTGALVDFYEKYLPRSLSIKNHEEILLEANKVLKGNVRNLTPPDNPLIAIAGADIANNADAYGLHLFQTACFLKEQRRLPKECEFMFERKINPAFYEEQESFEKVQNALSETMLKIPNKWSEKSFFTWLLSEDAGDYLLRMRKAADMGCMLSKIAIVELDCALDDYLRNHRVSERHHRPRPRRFGQRTNGG